MDPETEVTRSDKNISKARPHTEVAERDASTNEHAPTPWWRRIVGLVWDSLDNPDPEYRRYVQRLDRIFL